MKTRARQGLALAAVYPAVAVPILLPVLRTAHVPDAIIGFVMGALLGATMVMLVFALRSSRRRGC